MERTGHRSLEGVRNYKRTDEDQEKAISKLLQQPNASASAPVPLQQSNTTMIHHNFSSDNLPQLNVQNCNQFTININCSMK